MQLDTLCVYSFKVAYGEVNLKDEYKEITRTGITVGANFNEAVAKLTDYFGDDDIISINIKFQSDCDIVEENDLINLIQEVKLD